MNDFLTLSEASREIPGKPSLVTLWRWCSKGVKKGVRLESVCVGGKRMIHRDAIASFLRACTEAGAPKQCNQAAMTPARTAKQRAASIKAAEAILDGKQ